MPKFDWFGKIGIFTHEWGDDRVGVHVHRPSTRCTILEMTEEDFGSPDVWEKIKNKLESGDIAEVTGAKCIRCKMPLANWKRTYTYTRGVEKATRIFCAYCGEEMPK